MTATLPPRPFPDDVEIRDLGEQLDIDTAETLAALYRAEHDAFTATTTAVDGDGEPWLLHGFGMGHTEQCAVWPTEADIEAHRRHTVERILRTDIDPNRKAP